MPDICHTGRWECQNRTSGATSAIRLGARSASWAASSVTSVLKLTGKKGLRLRAGVQLRHKFPICS
jgi:hypothetical protein